MSWLKPRPTKMFGRRLPNRLCSGGLQTAIAGSRATDGALKCAAALRSRTAGSQDESPSRAIHNGKAKGAQLKLAATTSKLLRCKQAAACSAQFQRGQRKQREDQRYDPETHDDFRFAPAQQFEMMMQRGHAKNALTGELERADLDDHRQRFQHEHAAN